MVATAPNILFVANQRVRLHWRKIVTACGPHSIDRRKWPFGQTPHQPDLIVTNFAELAAALT